MSQPGFDSKQACRMTGVTVRQLNHWDRSGIVCPSVDPGRGSGMRRRYGVIDLVLLRLARELRSLGIGLAAVADAVGVARRHLGRPVEDHAAAGEASGGRATSGRLRTMVVGRESGARVVVGDRLRSALDDRTVAVVVQIDRLADSVRRTVAGLHRTQVLALELDDQSHPVVVTPQARGEGFAAACNAFAGLRGTGPSVEQAVADLAQAIRRGQVRVGEPKSARPARQPTRRRADRSRDGEMPRGASAWGDGW